MSLFSFLTRKAKVPKHNFYPLRSPSWLRGGRFQLAASSGPGSQTLPSCHHWRSQVPNPSGPSVSSGLPKGERPGPTDGNPGWLPLLQDQRDRDRGEVHCLPQRLVGALGEGSGAIQDTDFSLFSGVPAKARWAGGPQGEGPDLPLTSLSTSLTITALLFESYH